MEDNLTSLLANSLTGISLAEDFMSAYPKCLHKPDKATFEAVLDGRLTQRHNAFTEYFAHGECAVYAEGLMTALNRLGYDNTLLVLVECDTPIHYVVEIQHEGKTLYGDAYGIYADLTPIIDRYTENTVDAITPLKTFDDESNPLCDIWRESICRFMGNFDDDEIADRNECHYSEIYEDFTVSIVCQNAERILEQANN